MSCDVCKVEEESLLCTMRVTSLNKKKIYNEIRLRTCSHCCSWVEDRFESHHQTTFKDPSDMGPVVEGFQLHSGD